jgi:hypothetical protein
MEVSPPAIKGEGLNLQSALLSLLTTAVTLTLFYAGAGWWALLVYVVDVVSYICGRLEDRT